MLYKMSGIAKLTIYVTPEQWNRLSSWSATDVASREESRLPWLHLRHESNMDEEFIKLKNAITTEILKHEKSEDNLSDPSHHSNFKIMQLPDDWHLHASNSPQIL